MIRSALRSAVVAAALLAPRPGSAAMPAVACDIPADLIAPAHRLPHLAAALRPGARLDVLALGSGTLLGVRGGVEGSVPEHMAEALHLALPHAAIRLTLHAARAETAAEMLAAMRKELAEHPYQLVLWQTGTVEAVRKLPEAQFRDTLAAGAAAATAAGADLVLIGVPYSRLLVQNADLQPYRATMQEMAGHSDVVLFPRYDLMRHWAETGMLDVEAAGKRDRWHAADELRACLGRSLAKLLLAARP